MVFFAMLVMGASLVELDCGLLTVGHARITSHHRASSGSRSRQLTVTQAGLGDRVSRVAKGYTFFYGDKAGEHPLPSLLPSLPLT